MQVSLAQPGRRVGHVDARAGPGGEDLQRIDERQPATQLAQQIDARHGIRRHRILQHVVARAEQQAVDGGQAAEGVVHALDDGHGLPVFVFGTKGMAEDVYNCFADADIDIAGFIDNNKSDSDMLFSKKIYSLNEIEDYKDVCVVVIATVTYVYEIQKQLENSGFKNILPAYVLEFCDGLNFKQNPSIKNLVADYFEHKADYQKIRNLLCDDLSKRLLMRWLSLEKLLI